MKIITLGPLFVSNAWHRAPEILVAARARFLFLTHNHKNGRLINGYTELIISIVVIFASLE
jgi:hypothetical protein